MLIDTAVLERSAIHRETETLINATSTHHIKAFDYDLVLFPNDLVDNALLALLYTTEHLNLVASHNVPSVRRYKVVLRKPRLILHSWCLQLPNGS
jgi:hypothetical protein